MPKRGFKTSTPRPEVQSSNHQATGGPKQIKNVKYICICI